MFNCLLCFVLVKRTSGLGKYCYTGCFIKHEQICINRVEKSKENFVNKYRFVFCLPIGTLRTLQYWYRILSSKFFMLIEDHFMVGSDI